MPWKHLQLVKDSCEKVLQFICAPQLFFKADVIENKYSSRICTWLEITETLFELILIPQQFPFDCYTWGSIVIKIK